MLKLERQYTSTEIAVELRQSISESENAGFGNEDPEDQTSENGRLNIKVIRKPVARRLTCSSAVDYETLMVVRRSVLGLEFQI